MTSKLFSKSLVWCRDLFVARATLDSYAGDVFRRLSHGGLELRRMLGAMLSEDQL